MALTIQSTLAMNNGGQLPRLGLGVFRAPAGEITKRAVLDALEAGYRHIDTAKVYGNETAVGQGIKESGLSRSEIFVTTKLWNSDQGYDEALSAFEESLEALGLEYIDLYLLHWPVVDQRLKSWRALEKLQKAGRAKAIGVSNFMVRHLEELLGNSEILPAVNQIELSPFSYRSRLDVINLCKEKRILIEAYSPLTKGRKLSDPTLAQISEAHSKTPAQVLLRWGLQKDFVIIPKSTNKARIEENAALYDFALTNEEMQMLDDKDEDLVTGWDPTNAP